ncbi:YihY/virulence factor BrkB family protein [Sphingobacteriales bacterium UPWRP_1]|nr:hypothetical protein B6N25_12095 [Sphingobacteriales bacterium TSM_CSS]PSJ77158.1 YihY/virulence factor BrkB family protein [Sphingobacteriales bacterium UPWRP_1]
MHCRFLFVLNPFYSVPKLFLPIIEVVKNTFYHYSQDHVPSLAAALSFYTILSLSPILMVILLLLGNFLGAAAIEGQIDQNLSIFIGEQAAAVIHEVAISAFQYQGSIGITLIGIISTYFSATSVWVQLQWAFNYIWGVQSKQGTRNIIAKYLKDQLVALLIILVIVVFVVLGLLYGTLLSIFDEYLKLYLSDSSIDFLRLINFVVSYGLSVLLFALAFKYIPDVQLAWRHVWWGAVFTSLLFGAGRYLIGLYLSRGGISSAYGVAGSLVLLLLWVYYISIILLLGAEFTKALFLYKGHTVVPTRYAILTKQQQ